MLVERRRTSDGDRATGRNGFCCDELGSITVSPEAASSASPALCRGRLREGYLHRSSFVGPHPRHSQRCHNRRSCTHEQSTTLHPRAPPVQRTLSSAHAHQPSVAPSPKDPLWRRATRTERPGSEERDATNTAQQCRCRITSGSQDGRPPVGSWAAARRPRR